MYTVWIHQEKSGGTLYHDYFDVESYDAAMQIVNAMKMVQTVHAIEILDSEGEYLTTRVRNSQRNLWASV